MMLADYLIIGAGVSGLTAALILKKQQPAAKVVVLDAATEAGGLLKSVGFEVNNQLLAFDLGTHIPEVTPSQELNELLFPQSLTSNWQTLTELKVGNFFNGKLNNQSQFLNVGMDNSLFCKALTEILQTQSNNTAEFENLYDYLIAHYGSVLTDNLFAPLMAKMTEADLSELIPQTIHFYGLGRMTLGNRQMSLNLKKIPHLDQVLAFAQDSERPRESTWVYPGEKGVGEWVSFMYQACLNQNVEFLMPQRIQSLQKNSQGYGLLTDQGVKVQAKKLIWTLPFYKGLQGGEQTLFHSRSIAIYHFTSDFKPLTDRHYIYCHQSNMNSYRITFYDNITPKKQENPYRVTVEVIFDGQAPESDCIKQELITMGVFAEIKQIQNAGMTEVPYGFPIPKVGQQKTQQALFEKVKQCNPGVVFAGRGEPGLFFTTEVLMHVHQRVIQDAGVLENI